MSSRAPGRRFAQSIRRAPVNPWIRSNVRRSDLELLAMRNILNAKAKKLADEKPELLPFVIPLPEQTEDELNDLCQAPAIDWDMLDSPDNATNSWSQDNTPWSEVVDRLSRRRSWDFNNNARVDTEHVEDVAMQEEAVREESELDPEERRLLRLRNVLDDHAEDRDVHRLEAALYMRDRVNIFIQRSDWHNSKYYNDLKDKIKKDTPPRQYLRHPQNISEMDTDATMEDAADAPNDA